MNKDTMITVKWQREYWMAVTRSPHRYFLAALVFLLPLNIYVVGDWIGAGVQFSLFRYQQTYMGSSMIPLLNDLNYVLSGAIVGKSALSLLIWIAAVGSMAITLFLLIGHARSADPKFLNKSGIFLFVAACLLVASMMLQYGPTFHGVSGFSIPVGVPLVLYTGWWLFTAGESPEIVPAEEEGFP
jgi:hypothetical protein